MQQQVDDFTIPLPPSTDMGACELKVYSDLERLWRMVARYAMTSPLTITVVNNKAERVRSICGNHHETTGWELKDEIEPAVAGNAEFPLTIRVQDARGNILKLRIQLELAATDSTVSKKVEALERR
jgi:hypothetical protein